MKTSVFPTAAASVASDRSDATRLLLLHGPSGVGKTHVLRSIVHLVRARHPDWPIVLTTGREVVDGLMAALRAEGMRTLDVFGRARGGLLVVDDLHVLVDLPVTQAEIARLLQDEIRWGTRVLCAAGCTPGAMAGLTDRLRALPGASLIQMRPPTGRVVREVLVTVAAAQGLEVPLKRLTAMTRPSHGDLGRALGALTRHRFAVSLQSGADRHP